MFGVYLSRSISALMWHCQNLQILCHDLTFFDFLGWSYFCQQLGQYLLTTYQGRNCTKLFQHITIATDCYIQGRGEEDHLLLMDM